LIIPYPHRECIISFLYMHDEASGSKRKLDHVDFLISRIMMNEMTLQFFLISVEYREIKRLYLL